MRPSPFPWGCAAWRSFGRSRGPPVQPPLGIRQKAGTSWSPLPGARRSPLEGAHGPGSPPSGCRWRAEGRRVQGAGAGGPRPAARGRGQAKEASRLPAAAERRTHRRAPTARR